MLAVMVAEFGPPSVLVPADLPDPVPGPGQVVVEAAFANITFVETQIRAGHPPNPAMTPALPAVLGNGMGGVVSAVGEGADPGLAGTRVVTSTGGSGGYAQRCTVPADGLIQIPDLLPTDEAVALLADGRTALALADAAAPRPGETVLVEAAAGGVGSLLVQLAKHAGARVVALAGGPRKLGQDESVYAALRAGARGYLLKGAPQQDLISAIQAVAQGQAVFGTTTAAAGAPSWRPG